MTLGTAPLIAQVTGELLESALTTTWTDTHPLSTPLLVFADADLDAARGFAWRCSSQSGV